MGLVLRDFLVKPLRFFPELVDLLRNSISIIRFRDLSMLLHQQLKTSWSARYVAYNSVRGCRMSVVALSFNKRVIYQESRTFQILSLRCVAGKCSSVNRPEQIASSWAAHGGFRNDQCDRSVGVETASRQRPDGRFCWNAYDQPDHLSRDRAIIKRHGAVLVRPHSNVELLGCRIVRLGSIRIPNHSPPAAGRHARQVRDLQLEHEVICPWRLCDGDPVDRKRGWS